jgi:hypothetical protein
VSEFKGRHFEGEIVLWAVRWYCNKANRSLRFLTPAPIAAPLLGRSGHESVHHGVPLEFLQDCTLSVFDAVDGRREG